LGDAAKQEIAGILGEAPSSANVASELGRVAGVFERVAKETESDFDVRLFSNVHAKQEDEFGDILMHPLARQQAGERRFRAEDIELPGVVNYRGTVKLTEKGTTRVGGDAFAAGYHPQIDNNEMRSHDIRFRPQPIKWDAINAIQMMVGQANAPFV